MVSIDIIIYMKFLQSKRGIHIHIWHMLMSKREALAYGSLTEALQKLHWSLTKALQKLHRSLTGAPQKSYRDFTEGSQKRFGSLANALSKSYKSLTETFLGPYGSFKKALQKIYRSLTGVWQKQINIKVFITQSTSIKNIYFQPTYTNSATLRP